MSDGAPRSARSGWGAFLAGILFGVIGTAVAIGTIALQGPSGIGAPVMEYLIADYADAARDDALAVMTCAELVSFQSSAEDVSDRFAAAVQVTVRCP